MRVQISRHLMEGLMALPAKCSKTSLVSLLVSAYGVYSEEKYIFVCSTFSVMGLFSGLNIIFSFKNK